MRTLNERLKGQRWLGGPGFLAIGRRLFPRTDLAVQRATRGRWSLSGAAGLPLLLLTTTGRRTGRSRVTPLAYAEDPAGLYVIGSNWGQAKHPAWALNLLAEPAAVVERRGAATPVTATLLRGGERARAWESLVRIWPHYPGYAARVAARELLIFRLSPAAAPGGAATDHAEPPR